jgi:hypothetical protein
MMANALVGRFDLALDFSSPMKGLRPHKEAHVIELMYDELTIRASTPEEVVKTYRLLRAPDPKPDGNALYDLLKNEAEERDAAEELTRQSAQWRQRSAYLDQQRKPSTPPIAYVSAPHPSTIPPAATIPSPADAMGLDIEIEVEDSKVAPPEDQAEWQAFGGGRGSPPKRVPSGSSGDILPPLSEPFSPNSLLPPSPFESVLRGGKGGNGV